MVLIAEIGNNHFGSVDRAKMLIKSAIASGADLVKMQAFEASDLLTGSMPPDFYKQCELSFVEYKELAEYCMVQYSTPLFFSVFSPKFWNLNTVLPSSYRYTKVSGGQFKVLSNSTLEAIDSNRTFVSIPYDHKKGHLPALPKSHIMHVCEYLTDDPKLDRITALSSIYKKQCGFSDHTIGVDAVLKAIGDYGATVIEKHFNVGGVYTFKGVPFRDTIHAAQPHQLEVIAKALEQK